MKHLIVFSVIIIGIIFLTLISRYDNLYFSSTKRGVYAGKSFNKTKSLK